MKSLLVEDNPADARLIAELLKHPHARNFQLHHVSRLGLALERLCQEPFDMVLLDLGLPDSRGMETLTRIQKEFAGLPVVVLTGLDDERFALEVVRAGAQDYLLKGRFDSELLVRTMRYAVERKSAEEEVRRLNAELEQRVDERTGQLQRTNDTLRKEVVERKRAEEELNRQNRTLDGINQIFAEALRCETEEDLGRICLAVAEDLTASKFGFIAELGADGLLHDIAISDPGWELCTMYDQTGHRRPPANFKIHGLYGRVILSAESLLVNNPAAHPDSIGTPAGHPPLTAFLGVPLRDGNRVIGMIAVANREGGYRQLEQDSLEAVAPAIVQILHRKRTEQALIRSEKLASAGRLAATIAHEVNNPLDAAMNAVYLVGGDPSLSREARAFLQIAEKELRRAAQIVRRTLGFYREPNNRTRIVLAELLKDLVAAYEPQIRNKGLQVRVRCDERAAVMGNTGEIGQLFSNLLANSIDAVGAAAILHLRVARCSRNGGAPLVRVTVADTGAGIEPINVRRIFEPFFTTKKNVGTGLGLWISDQVVKKHGGTIRVRSRIGRGTVFAVTLPAAAAAAPVVLAARVGKK